jgi:hypothetical protein
VHRLRYRCASSQYTGLHCYRNFSFNKAMLTLSNSSHFFFFSDQSIIHTTTYNKTGVGTMKVFHPTNLPLRRTHERVLFVVYLLGGLAFTVKVDGVHAETTLITVWLSFILAISFMETWVRYKAPLLRRNVAVDVGRHIFGALTAVEFGLAGAFWITRYSTKGSSSSSFFPAVATVVLLFLSFFLLPLIFIRAKQKIVNEAGPPEIWTTEEKVTLKLISNEISGEPVAPITKLPLAYTLLEMTKAICLFLFLCW